MLRPNLAECNPNEDFEHEQVQPAQCESEPEELITAHSLRSNAYLFSPQSWGRVSFEFDTFFARVLGRRRDNSNTIDCDLKDRTVFSEFSAYVFLDCVQVLL